MSFSPNELFHLLNGCALSGLHSQPLIYLMAAPCRACIRSRSIYLMAAPYRACIRSRSIYLMAAPYRACIRSRSFTFRTGNRWAAAGAITERASVRQCCLDEQAAGLPAF
jgi:hypothetical protein